MNIKKTGASLFPAAHLTKHAPVPAAAKPESRGWLPTVVKSPGPNPAAERALEATANAVKRGLETGFDAVKTTNEALAGPRSPSTSGPYKYQGPVEIGLEALNRTFEGGGMDVAKGVRFIKENAKLK